MTSSPDLILVGGRIADGSGGPLFYADVAITGGRISAVGPGLNRESATVIDVSGHVVAPGFIDAHTHDDWAVLAYPEMGFKIQGGVTTCVVGNCGIGAAPFGPSAATAASFHPNETFEPWEGYASYIDRVNAIGPSVNVAVLMGHGTIRQGAMGPAERESTDEELAVMAESVREGLAAGCIGLSSGLQYVPGTYADPSEIVALARLVGEAGGVYTSHMRSEGDGLMDSVTETISVGRLARVPVVISHLKATGDENWGRVSDALEAIAAARAEGLTVDADQYPYTAGSTILSALTHERAFSDDPGGFGSMPPDRVVIASSEARPEWVGRTVSEIAAGIGTTPEAAADTLVATDPLATCVLHRMSEEDVRTIVADPRVMIGSDGLPTMEGQPHPRLYATFARVLGHYSRQLGVVDLPTAVHKMTGLPARVFGLDGRGTITAGAVADITVFDPATILDTATYAEPHQTPPGIRLVLVNGTTVVDRGTHTGARPGRVIRRRAP